MLDRKGGGCFIIVSFFLFFFFFELVYSHLYVNLQTDLLLLL